MGFLTVATTTSAAVATNGTFTVTAPVQAIVGAIKSMGGHYFIARQMGALFNFPADWSISWSTTTGTITYLGTTTIPAGTTINVQFETFGDDANSPYRAINSNVFDKDGSKGAGGGMYRGAIGQMMRVDMGAPVVASTTAIDSTVASITQVLGVVAYTTPFILDVPRALQATSSSASDTTVVVSYRGFDEYGAAMTENFALNGTSVISGKKAFKVVVSRQITVADMVGNLSTGFLEILGLPFYLPADNGTGAGGIGWESDEGIKPTAGTFVGGVLTKATATTGDVRGTVKPNVTRDGVKTYKVFMFVPDTAFLGVPQYSA